MTGIKIDSASSNPALSPSPSPQRAHQDPDGRRDGEAEPTRHFRRRALPDGRIEITDLLAFRRFKDPEVHAAFVAAHFAWAKARAPWLLGEACDD